MMVFMLSLAKKYNRYLKKHPQIVAAWLVLWRVIQMLQTTTSLENILQFALLQPTPELQESARRGLVQVGPDLIELLVQLTISADKTISTLAKTVLEQLALPESRQALCQIALTAAPLAATARRIAVKANYYPQELHERALFFFLTAQLERYQGLDFDGRLLRLMYELADAALRREIVNVAREAGRSDLLVSVVSIQVGANDKLQSLDLSDEEWKSLCRALIENKQHEAMWKIAQVAPPAYSVELVLEVFRQNKKNQKQPLLSTDETTLKQLARAARRCHESGPLLLGKNLIERIKLAEPDFRPAKFAISWDNRYLAAISFDGRIRLWNLPDGKLFLKTSLRKFSLKNVPQEAKTDSHFRWSKLQTLAFQFTTSGEIIWVYQWRERVNNNWWQTALVKFTLDQQHNLNLVNQIEISSKVEPRISYNTPFAISPDGSLMSVKGLTMWSLPNFELLPSREPADYGFSKTIERRFAAGQVIFHPNGENLIVTSNAYVWIWQGLRKLPITIRGYNVAINSGGSILASLQQDDEHYYGFYSSIFNIYRFPNSLYKSFKFTRLYYNPITSFTVSPDGECLACGYNSGTLELWQSKESSPDFSVKKGKAAIIQISFTQDGKSLITLDRSGELKLWTTKLIELCRQPLSKAKLDDFIFLQEARQNPDALLPEIRWLNFIWLLLKWKFQHEIEIGEVGENFEVDFADFDIELADADFENV